MSTLISIPAQRLKYTGGIGFNVPEDIDIPVGVVAFTGPNGSGKSLFAAIVAHGRNFATNRIYPTDRKLNIRIVEFSDIHSLAGHKSEYYQQRYESGMNDNVPTVAEVFASRINDTMWLDRIESMGLTGALNKAINALSSGELRKLLLSNALADMPDLLVLDNPFIGLDIASRTLVEDAILKIGRDGGSVWLLMSDPTHVPEAVTYRFTINNRTIRRDETSSGSCSYNDNVDEIAERVSSLITDVQRPLKKSLVAMHNVSVSYGDITVIDGLNWNINCGEHWALTGPNGSGKSTLLSLINADNPKAYNNDIQICGQRRGCGESIWDIKRMIGFVSPEQHLYFADHNANTAKVIAAGLNDFKGLYVPPKNHEFELAHRWLEVFEMEGIADTPYRLLSAGQQRVALICRTLIKNAPFLILDEPMHGLDPLRKKILRVIVTQVTSRPGTSSIFVTHRLEELPSNVTHMMKMPEGVASRL